ncbi:TRAP transporter large permease [Psychrobacillus sp. FSL K6-2836]|uniref:TRAP transporter large permease n=1 Tax=Psychrobacillus sp. FSL K6-2836 TaxID=2921548 RepID=UPI0030FAA8E1
MELLVFIVSLFVLLTFGIPIALVLVLSATALMFFMDQWNPVIISQSMVQGANSFTLMAVPFFMLAGEIMAKGGLSRLLVQFASILVGRINGGIGYTAVLASILFAGLSGSAVADAAALGAILIPIMKSRGYDIGRSTGLVTASSLIAVIIPPSIPLILLGSMVGISISRLFMAGIVPGLLIGLALMVTWFLVAKKDGYEDKEIFTAKEAWQITKKSLPALFMPILIIGGIRFGIFTPTEAGVFATVYAFLVSIFIYKELKMKDMGEIFVKAAQSTAVVMLVVAAASAVAWLITIAQLPVQVASLLGGFMDSPMLLLMVIIIFLFLVGMVMDMTPAILIFAPILFPVIIQAGIDPYFFGIIMVFNLAIGLITPPVGTLLYLGSSIGNISFGQMLKGIMPFLIAEILMMLLYAFVPELITTPMKWFTE